MPPNKRLGQHFLINKSAIGKIISALNLQPNDMIIEIGPGKGALTLPMAEKLQITNYKSQIIAVEKDLELANNLELGIRNYGNIKIIKGDALKMLPPLIHDSSFLIQNYKVVGNIPYYITGKLLRILSELENKPKTAVLMIQKEVAERLTAKEGKMNLLAAAVQFWAEPETLFTLKPNDFNPPPKVESAVIRLTPAKPTTQNIRPTTYYKIIKVIFKQPRKTLSNNLRSGLNLTKDKINSVFNLLNIPPEARPQDLSLEKIKELATIIQPQSTTY